MKIVTKIHILRHIVANNKYQGIMKKIFTTIAVTGLIFMAIDSFAQTTAPEGSANSEKGSVMVIDGQASEVTDNAGQNGTFINGTMTPDELMAKYKGVKNADHLTVDGFLLKLGKLALKMEGELPKEAVDAIKKIQILTLDDCGYSVKSQFRAEVEQVFAAYSLIMDVNDDDDNIKIYVRSIDENSFEDFVVYESDDCSLIVMTGRFTRDALSGMIDGHMD